MPRRDEPRWSIRVTAEEDERVKKWAAALGVSPALVVRAAVGMLRSRTMADLEFAVSELSGKVPVAAASPSRASGAGAVSSPAPARRVLVEVVVERLGVRKPFAVRQVRQGLVRVGGVVVRDPELEVIEGEVQV